VEKEQNPEKVKNDMARKNTQNNVSSTEAQVQNTDQEKVQRIVSSLKSLLDTGDDWQRRDTSVKGVSIIRLPANKTRNASLAVEINPVNAQGTPMKKKGVMILSIAEIEAFVNVFSDQRLPNLVNIVNDVSGVKRGSSHKSNDIIEI